MKKIASPSLSEIRAPIGDEDPMGVPHMSTFSSKPQVNSGYARHDSVQTSAARPLVRLTSVRVRASTPFSHHIKDLRQRFGGKQWWLGYVSGCTDAAVSFWESGKRIPAAATLTRIVYALTQAGATPNELASLRRSWVEAKAVRRAAKRGRGYDPHRLQPIALVAERKLAR